VPRFFLDSRSAFHAFLLAIFELRREDRGMKRNPHVRLFGIVFLSTAILSPVLGGPLKATDIGADPAWVAHIDCDALHTNSPHSGALTRFIQSQLEKQQVQDKLDALQAIAGLDLRTQLHGITCYAPGEAPRNGVLLGYADFDPERLTTLAKANDGYKSSEHGKHTIHSWFDKKKTAEDGEHPRVYAALSGKRIVVFGPKEDSLASALDVIDGSAPNLSSSKSYAQFLNGAGNPFFKAAARKLPLPAKNPLEAVFGLSTQIRYQVAETEENLTTTIGVDAKSHDIATNIVAIAQGAAALMRLQTERPEIAELAKGFNVKEDGTAITITMSVPGDKAIECFKTMVAAGKKAAKAHHGAQKL
jgi:hypothetical protein